MVYIYRTDNKEIKATPAFEVKDVISFLSTWKQEQTVSKYISSRECHVVWDVIERLSVAFQEFAREKEKVYDFPKEVLEKYTSITNGGGVLSITL